MRARITVQSYTTTRDNMGGTIETYADNFTAFASVKFSQVGSEEKMRNEQLTGKTSVIFTIRKRAVSTSDRVVFDGELYEIDAVLPTGDRLDFLTLECYRISEHKTAA